MYSSVASSDIQTIGLVKVVLAGGGKSIGLNKNYWRSMPSNCVAEWMLLAIRINGLSKQSYFAYSLNQFGSGRRIVNYVVF
jgi:hypothetical protein